MKRCLKCKNKYMGHGGSKCGLDSMPIDSIKKCNFLKAFKIWESQAKRAGYWLKAEKIEVMT